MNRFAFPRTLPPCAPVLPAFAHHFSGWQLGMGLPEALAGLLPGLFLLSEENPGCRSAALGMALWSMQAHPLDPDLARWAVKAVNLGLKADPALARLMALSADLERPAEGEAADTWYELARQDDRG